MTRKRDKLKRLTYKQIERLMEIGRKTWMSLNSTLKNGKWKKNNEEKINDKE